MGIFLGCNLTTAEYCSCLHVAIVGDGSTVDFRHILDWLRVALTRKRGTYQPSPLAISRPTAPLVDVYLTRHRHQFLTRHLPGLFTVLQRMQGLLITTHIGEVVLDMRQDREEKTCVRYLGEIKVFSNLLGGNITYLLLM